MENVTRFIVFSVLLTIYVFVLVIIAQILPYVLLILLLVWMIYRQPMSRPDLIDSDVRMIGNKTGEMTSKLLELLVKPLKNIS